MSEINLGSISLTKKQIQRLHEAHINGVRGYKYSDGSLTVNHEKEDLSQAERKSIRDAVAAIPDDDTMDSKREKELSNKQSLNISELVELLKLRRIL